MSISISLKWPIKRKLYTVITEEQCTVSPVNTFLSESSEDLVILIRLGVETVSSTRFSPCFREAMLRKEHESTERLKLDPFFYATSLPTGIDEN